MKLEIKKGSENYAATIVEIDNIHPIKEVDELFNLNTKLPREVNRKYLQQLLLKIRKDA